MDDSVELRSLAGSVLKDSFPSPPGEGEDEGVNVSRALSRARCSTVIAAQKPAAIVSGCRHAI